MADDDGPDRPDLGAMAFRLARSVADAEQPVLGDLGVTMWEYVVLGALDARPAPTQVELARLTGRDPTRLIRHIDDLERRGLLAREPDPADRRRRVVAATPEGRALLRRCRAAVRELEDRVMTDVSPADRAAFLRVLHRLSDDVRPDDRSG